LAVEDLDVGQVHQVFGDGDDLGGGVTGRQRIGCGRARSASGTRPQLNLRR
jgi:hypothetical protein